MPLDQEDISQEIERASSFREYVRAVLIRIEAQNDKQTEHLAKLNGRVGKAEDRIMEIKEEMAIRKAQQEIGRIKHLEDAVNAIREELAARKAEQEAEAKTNANWRRRIAPYVAIIIAILTTLVLLNGPGILQHIHP